MDGPPVTRETVGYLTGLWLVGVVIVVAALADAPASVLITLAITGTVVMSVATIVWHRLRVRRIGALERLAARLLDQGSPESPIVLGERIPAHNALAPLADALERVSGRLDAQLKETARQSSNLNAVIDALDEPIIATGEHERVILCNRAAEGVLGASAGGLSGRSIDEVITHSALIGLHREAKTGATRRGKVRLTTALGSRTFQVSACPVPAAWGQGVFGVVLLMRDVTELDEAVRIKSDFAANASHELRTPVAAIKAAAETLCMHADEDDQRTRRIGEIIDNHAGRLEELVRDLLDLSRVESDDATVRIDAIDMDDLEAGLTDLFAPTCAARRLTLDFETTDAPRAFRSDARLVGMMIRNLIENATRFANRDSVIRVRTSVAHDTTLEHTPSNLAKTVVRFEVIDKGPGIPIEHQERVFERFFQAEPARRDDSGHRGTGLGLAIVKHAAGALGGQVGLKSTWGRGTRVWFEIPVAPIITPVDDGQSSGA